MSGEGEASGSSSVNRKAKGTIDVIHEEVKNPNRPILFPNHQKQLRIFTIFATAGTAIYMSLFSDFGDHEHVFSPLRRFVFGYMNKLKGKVIKLDPEEEANLLRRIDELKENASKQ